MLAHVTTALTLNDRVTELLRRVDYRCADSTSEREAIFRQRYDAYLREGEITQGFSEQFTDPVDDAANTWIIGVYIDDALAGSIRLSVTIPGCTELPSTEVFPDLLLPEIEAGRTIIDPTRFVADHESSKRHPELPYVILRAPWIAMEYFKADLMLAAVRREHQAFYRRLWGNQTICTARPYPGLSSDINLMTCEYLTVQDQVHRRYPFFQSSFLERKMLFGRECSVVEHVPELIRREHAPASLV